jgi:hypothetical protein
MHCKFINFVFQIFSLVIPEIPAASVLHCSDYPHLFRLDPVTTAIWLLSFDLKILIILNRTMVYASSIYSNLYSLCLKLFSIAKKKKLEMPKSGENGVTDFRGFADRYRSKEL